MDAGSAAATAVVNEQPTLQAMTRRSAPWPDLAWDRADITARALAKIFEIAGLVVLAPRSFLNSQLG
jgi:hypothetical protein